MLVSVETELILAVKLLFFYPCEDSLVFLLNMHRSHWTESEPRSSVSVSCSNESKNWMLNFWGDKYNTHPKSKSVWSSLTDYPGKPTSLPYPFSSWSLKKLAVSISLESYLECSEEQKIEREFWFQAYSVHLNSKMLFSLHECKFQTSLAEW